MFIKHTLRVFRAIRRVLREDGTLWLNMGDSYAKSKDLHMMPARVALALQADGWFLRSDIIWAKPNPVPESMTDRPTKAHEHIFLLTKSARYFYDAEAIKERASENTHGRGTGSSPKNELEAELTGRHKGFGESTTAIVSSRNKRSVWTMATQPFPQAHFATFPLELPETCIKAGTSAEGVCEDCGAPWVRILKPTEAYAQHLGKGKRVNGYDYDKDKSQGMAIGSKVYAEYRTMGWKRTCKCSGVAIPATVLDPFSGAGTSGLAALRLQRDFIGIDIKGEYAQMARHRIIDDAPLLNTPAEIAAD
jgi:DNA modification methylase